KVFEVISSDPSQGLVFYTIDTERAEKPHFERRFAECLNCHGPANGMVVSSVYPSADGPPFVTGTFFEGIDHRTPLENRWGGWYVSGTHGSLRHPSDIVALMVLEHQVRMTNLIAGVGQQFRRASNNGTLE